MTCPKCNDSAVVTSAQQVLHEHSYTNTCCSWIRTHLVKYIAVQVHSWLSTSAQLASEPNTITEHDDQLLTMNGKQMLTRGVMYVI